MIVIDVGCARYGGDYSIERLIEEFHPDVLYGFDPSWHPTMLVPGFDDIDNTTVHVWEKAAWTYDGTVQFRKDGLNGFVSSLKAATVQCIDLARFIKELPDEEEIVLKIDAEGSEYELLEHLIANGVDERLSIAWVEWHRFGVPQPARTRKIIEGKIRCQIDEWKW